MSFTNLMAAARACMLNLGLPIQHIEQVCIGENGIFRVKTADDEFPAITLRLHRSDARPCIEIEAELSWVAALHTAGLPVPRPLRWPVRETCPTSDLKRTYIHVLSIGHPEGWAYASALTWIDGTPAPLSPDIAMQSELGTLLACLHHHACEWSTPARIRRPQLRADRALGHSEPIRFAAIRTTFGPDFEMRCRTVHAHLWPILAALPQSPPHGGLIHCDLVASNLLVKHCRLHVIDFDDACYAPFLYDIVTAAYDWLEHQPESLSYIQQLGPLCKGYATIRPVPPMNEQCLEALVFIRALGTLSWALQRADQSRVSLERRTRAVQVIRELLNHRFAM